VAAQDLVNVILKDDATEKNLAPQSLAKNILFSDGESLQFKYDNEKLIQGDITNGLLAVSPTIEVIENTDSVFRLKITDINNVIITPNLIGPKGPKGDLANIEDGTVVKVVDTYELQFVANDFSKINETTYLLRINRTQHELGYNAKVTEVLRYKNDSEMVNIEFAYKRLVNGDIVMICHESFAGIIYLEGDNKE